MTQQALESQVKTMEAQLAVLKAQLQRLDSRIPPRAFKSLYGILAGRVDTSDGEIENAKFTFDWEERPHQQGRP